MTGFFASVVRNRSVLRLEFPCNVAVSQTSHYYITLFLNRQHVKPTFRRLSVSDMTAFSGSVTTTASFVPRLFGPMTATFLLSSKVFKISDVLSKGLAERAFAATKTRGARRTSSSASVHSFQDNLWNNVQLALPKIYRASADHQGLHPIRIIMEIFL